MAFRRTAVALRHVAFEDLGLLAPVLDEAGWSVSFCDAAVEDLSSRAVADADLLIVLGGPIGAYEIETYPFLGREISIIERRLGRKRPTLGICLGSQLMAAALGARVFPGGVKEIGWGRVELTEAGAASCLSSLAVPSAHVLHWHGDTFDLPEGATRLASNARYENQAFSFGPTALALQFHLEADPRQLEEWYVGHAVELGAAGINVIELRKTTRALASGLGDTAMSVFSRWLAQIEL
jgi:GMP synthase (glutamine-hydrolysing)